MKTNCKVIKDLLPLYIDAVCSDDSKKMVEEHLEGCDTCSATLKAQSSRMTVSDDEIKQNLKAKNPFKKIKRQQKVEAISALICGIIIILLFAYKFNSPDFSEPSFTWTPLMYGLVILTALMIVSHTIQLIKRKDIFTLVAYYVIIITFGLVQAFTGSWFHSIWVFLLYPIVLLFSKGDTKRK